MVHVPDAEINMKTTRELQEKLDCKKWQVKKIAAHQGWERINKRGFLFYDITDDQINEYLANPIALSNHDYTLDLWRLTLGWIK